MKLFFTLFFFLFSLTCSYSQAFIGLKTFGSDKFNDGATGVVTDTDDNTIICGTFQNTITFGSKTLTSQGTTNIFIVKFNSKQEVLWALRVGAGDDNYCSAVTVDRDNNIYITGYLNSTSVDFGKVTIPGPYARAFLAKISPQGAPLWLSFTFTRSNTVATDDQGYIYIANENLDKYNSDGTLVWTKKVAIKIWEEPSFYINSMCIRKNRILISGGYGTTIVIGKDTLIYKYGVQQSGIYSKDVFVALLDTSANIKWARNARSGYNDESFGGGLDEAGNCYIAGLVGWQEVEFGNFSIYPKHNSWSLFIAKYDSTGTLMWVRTPVDNASSFSQAAGLYTDPIGNCYVTGINFGRFILGNFDNNSAKLNNDAFIAKIGPDGTPLWVDYIKGDTADIGKSITINSKGIITVVGNTYSTKLTAGKYSDINSRGSLDVFICQAIDPFVLRKDQSLVKGKVYTEETVNCIPEAYEPGLRSFIIKAEPGPQYAISNDKGEFEFQLDTGTYKITHQLPALDDHYKNTNCTNEYSVSLKKGQSYIENINFSDSLLNCPILTVDIATSTRRMAMQSYTYISYCNEGSAIADEVYIEVIYPNFYRPLYTTFPWYMVKDSFYVFKIGSLRPGDCGKIKLTDVMTQPMEKHDGSMQCVKARILPPASCGSGNWDKSTVEISGKCLGAGLIETAISNTGTGNMQDSSDVYIYLDSKLVYRKKVKLRTEETVKLKFNSEGKSTRVKVMQSLNHPVPGNPLFIMEGCEMEEEARPAYVNQLSLEDASNSYEMDCSAIVNSFDPNEKVVVPSGIGKENYVSKNEELEYTIHFQNLGTDTAFFVKVIDTLSQHLDFMTFKKGISSHEYKLVVSGTDKQVLEWNFSNILLPHAKKDSVGSNGFVKFKISPKAGLPDKTKVTNKSYIYFDFNSPVITNETSVSLFDTVVPGPSLSVIAYPILTTDSITQITSQSAVSGGKIIDDGGSQIIEKGICWNTSGNPTIKNNKVVVNGEETKFVSLLSNLNGRTLYFVRAFATNIAGTSYGNQVYFETPLPTDLKNMVENKVSIYPNPTSKSVSISLQPLVFSEVILKIINVNGEEVYSRKIFNQANGINEELDLTGIVSGVYFIRIISDNNSTTEKLIIK
ncbi:MAG: T9SS type A sorting domain-containing protein [Sporocytophaga sp.]|uniref:DUF7619 domain-containing protein n=1 Tax=Sporocytophaga sp. TaxID=2231183 RepID=UPI001B2C6BBD|nr:T9SS type A sorting domain-containing protein [Sporocytophaga sp.]MBO9700436.1 T9SS type A sorting domain-containing protein [Sporocytophaga sp.]